MSGIRSIRRGPTLIGSASGTSAPIYVDSDDNIAKMVPAGSGTTEVQLIDDTTAQTITGVKTMMGPVLSAPIISGAMTVASGATITSASIVTPTVKDLTEVVVTTNVILAAETGSVFFLGSATGFVSTLPTPAAGLRFTFIVSTAPTSGSHTVICAASGTLIKGHVLSNDLNAASDSDFGTAGELTLTFVVNKAVAGDRAEFFCDGTNWFVEAACSVFDAITIS